MLLRPDQGGREPVVTEALSEATGVVGTEWISPLEVTAAIRRRLPARERDDAERRWWEIWSRMVPVVFDGVLYEAALSGSRRHRLRSLDALHLAAALRVGCTRMVTFDRELASVAAKEGLEVRGG